MNQLETLHNLAVEKNYNQLYKELRPFIYKLVRRYKAGNEHDKDLVQCGRIGLFRAIETYDPTRSTNFFSHAHTYVKNEMYTYMTNQKRTVRIPHYQLNPNSPQYRADLPNHTTTISLSTPAYEDSSETQADQLESHYVEAVELDDLEYNKLRLLKPFISELKPNYQKVIMMRYEQNKTLKETGEAMGISKEGVRQIELKALDKLREKYKIK